MDVSSHFWRVAAFSEKGVKRMLGARESPSAAQKAEASAN